MTEELIAAQQAHIATLEASLARVRLDCAEIVQVWKKVAALDEEKIQELRQALQVEREEHAETASALANQRHNVVVFQDSAEFYKNENKQMEQACETRNQREQTLLALIDKEIEHFSKQPENEAFLAVLAHIRRILRVE